MAKTKTRVVRHDKIYTESLLDSYLPKYNRKGLKEWRRHESPLFDADYKG